MRFKRGLFLLIASMLLMTWISGVVLGFDAFDRAVWPELGPLNQGPHSQICKFTLTEGRDSYYIDFEGIADWTPVGVIPGVPPDNIDVTFGVSWNAILDSDLGGHGNFANEPSPDTAASGNTFPAPPSAISFSAPVAAVTFYYSAAFGGLPMTVEAYDDEDGAGNLVTTVVGNITGHSGDGAACVGDPTGQFCLWTPITLVSTSSNIRSLTFPTSEGNNVIIDSMTIYPVYDLVIPTTGPFGVAAMLLVFSGIIAVFRRIRR